MSRALHNAAAHRSGGRLRVVVMAKTPVMGRVKTRLGREVGPAAATRFYRATMSAVLGRLSRDPRFEIILAIAPDTGLASRGLPPGPQRVPQGAGDLGEKMQRLLERGPPGPVVLIGTDIPGIRVSDIAAAFRLLGRNDVVLGPAGDGGFWMVGYRRFPRMPNAFPRVRWSHAETLADVAVNLSGWRVAHGTVLSDVDSAADLVRLSPMLGRRVLPTV
jgi:uncharacterized protein